MNQIKRILLKAMGASLKVKLGAVLSVFVIGGGITTGVVYHNQHNKLPQKQVSSIDKEQVTSDKQNTISTNTTSDNKENVDTNKEQTSTAANTAVDTTKTNSDTSSNDVSKNNTSSSDSNKTDKNASTATSTSPSKNTNTSTSTSTNTNTSTSTNTNTSTSTSTNANTNTSPSKSNTNTNTNTNTNSSTNTSTNNTPVQPKRPTEIDWDKTEQANKDAGFYATYSGVTSVLGPEVKQSGINIFNGGTATKKLIDGITIQVNANKQFTYKYQGKNIIKVPHKSTYGWGEGMGYDAGGMTDNYCIVQWDASINDYVFYYVGMKLN